jgi:hypothetical protein
MKTPDEKLRETALRRKAARMGLVMRKSRRRDPDAPDHGLYSLVHQSTGVQISPGMNGSACSMTLGNVEIYLLEEVQKTRAVAKKKAARR